DRNTIFLTFHSVGVPNPHFPDQLMLRIVERHVHGVRSDLIIFEKHLPCGTIYGAGIINTQGPPCDIDLMCAVVSDVSRPIIPVPVPFVVEAILVKWHLQRRSRPGVVIHFWWNRAVILMSDVIAQLYVPRLCHYNFANFSGLDVFDCMQ